MTHPSESGRFYHPDGRPAYEVPGVKGMVKPDIRHAKKLGLRPSVTTILQEAAKPGLERWKVTQGILAALTLPRLPDESLDAFAERARRDSQEQAKKAAERGTAIHAAIQEWYETEDTGPDTLDYVEAVTNAVLKWELSNGGPVKWVAEQSFASPLGFGGKVDISSQQGAVMDFKTKEFDEPIKKLAWDEHCIQLAAYREGLGLPQAKCANVFVSVNHPGLVHIHEWSEDELQRGWRMFAALLEYWYAKTGLPR
jgi:hypothetical protein